MDPAVALVQAYLQINGYLTVTEFPVMSGSRSARHPITDVDLIALRFPGAVPVGGDPAAGPDPVLGLTDHQVDLLICEVKEGKGRLNPNLTRSETLEAVLHRVGCCPPEHLARHAAALVRGGEARMTHHGVPCRTRLALFAGRPGEARRAPLTVPLDHVARSVCRFLATEAEALHTARLTQPAMAQLALLAKLGLVRPAGIH